MGFFSKLKTAFGANSFQQSCQAIQQTNVEQLNQMHDELLTYVEEMPFPVAFPGSLMSDEEVRRRYDAFCQKPLPNGERYGCRTYGEAEALNQLVVKRLDELEN